MQKRKLPIGIQALAEIIQSGYYYVDKTQFAWQLVDEGKYYFLSRPRRFGKSLFLDTLKELFEGNEPLFRGLFIHDKWDWKQRYPVVRVSFGDGVIKSRMELDNRINQQLTDIRQALQLPPNTALDIAGNFGGLIRTAHQQYNAQVVVLIDEYDKPILDNITNPEAATEAREGLKNLYSVLKDADPHMKFCLLTGVSKFSKVSLFSGLNNLNDISMDAKYSAICGYTDTDIDSTFAAELSGLDRDEIRRWYNGYNWQGESVYNPFDALLLFQKREFKPYWFESATPTFLVKLLAERQFFTPNFDDLQTSSALLNRFDVQDISTEALLFQTGYLTLKSVEEYLRGKWLYRLTYPNLEVQASLNEALLPALGLRADAILTNGFKILAALRQDNFVELETQLKALYAGIPHDWYRNNPIANYEGHYASVFYSHFAALGLHVIVEDASNHGKVDMTVEFNNNFYLFEFKVVDDQAEGKALQQIKDKGYADKYRGKGQVIYLIGVEFSKTARQVVGFEVEKDDADT